MKNKVIEKKQIKLRNKRNLMENETEIIQQVLKMK